MATIIQKAVGAQRLYNAIKQKNSGLVGLFMLSSAGDTGATQPFHVPKVYEAWCEAPDLDVLRMLMNNPKVCRGLAINTRRHSQHFAAAVATKLAQIASTMDDDTPPVENIKLLGEGVSLIKGARNGLSADGLYSSDLASQLARLAHTRDWAWGVVEQHSEFVMQGLTMAINNGWEDYINLCLESDKVDRSINSYNLARAIVGNDRFDIFIRLYRTQQEQQAQLGQYIYANAFREAQTGHNRFTRMKAVMPWIES